MIQHRDIGHDWQLTDEQRQLFDAYLRANRLLQDCVTAARGLTLATRQWVEQTLLLPADDIANLPPPEPVNRGRRASRPPG